METHIHISIEVDQGQIDLSVPRRVTLGRLTELVHQALIVGNVTLPDDWHLELKDKPIKVDDFDLIAYLPISHGDIFRLTEGKSK